MLILKALNLSKGDTNVQIQLKECEFFVQRSFKRPKPLRGTHKIPAQSGGTITDERTVNWYREDALTRLKEKIAKYKQSL